MKQRWICIEVTLLLLLSSCVGIYQDACTTENLENNLVVLSYEIKSEYYSMQDEKKNYAISIEYPQIISSSNDTDYDEINKILMQRCVDGYSNYIPTNVNLSRTYTVKLATENRVSILVSGVAETITKSLPELFAINIDLTQKKILDLSEMVDIEDIIIPLITDREFEFINRVHEKEDIDCEQLAENYLNKPMVTGGTSREYDFYITPQKLGLIVNTGASEAYYTVIEIDRDSFSRRRDG